MSRGLRVAFARDRGEPLDRMVKRLAPSEQALARAIDPHRRRRHFALGRQAARRAIARLHERGARGVGTPVLRGTSGEPVVSLRRGGEVRVSVSHSGRLGVACAWRPREAGLTVGVDLERVRPTSVGESAWAFDARERRRLARAGDAHTALCAWVAKEAAWKALGLGPERGPEALEVLELGPGGCAVVLRLRDEGEPAADSGTLRVEVRRVKGPDSLYLFALAAAPQAWRRT